MDRFVVSLDQDGTARFIVSDATEVLQPEVYEIRRASHVEPVRPVLRWLFHLLRDHFGDDSVAAAITRVWWCTWRVNLSPIGGPVVDRVWCSRKAAIAYEVEWLEERFL